MPITTKLGRVITYNEKLPPLKSCDPLITWSSISSTTMLVTTKLDRVITYQERLPLIKLHDPLKLMIWHCEIS